MPRSEVKRQTGLHTKSYPLVKPQTTLVPTPSAPSFGQTIKEGIGFGAGSAIGHRIVGAVLGPSTMSTITSATPSTPLDSIQTSHQKCMSERNAFELCLKTKSQEDVCNNEFNAYTQCIQLN